MTGERPDDLAQALDPPATGMALRKAWRRVLGWEVGRSAYAKRSSADARNLRIYCWRRDEDLTYAECCERLGLEHTKPNENKLRNGLVRYCRRLKIPYPTSPRGSKHRGFREV